MVRGRRSNDKSPAPYPRTARVNQVLREIVADALERLSDIDDRLRMITVTSVDTAPDLRQAIVYLSSLSDEAAEALDDERKVTILDRLTDLRNRWCWCWRPWCRYGRRSRSRSGLRARLVAR